MWTYIHAYTYDFIITSPTVLLISMCIFRQHRIYMYIHVHSVHAKLTVTKGTALFDAGGYVVMGLMPAPTGVVGVTPGPLAVEARLSTELELGECMTAASDP